MKKRRRWFKFLLIKQTNVNQDAVLKFDRSKQDIGMPLEYSKN